MRGSIVERNGHYSVVISYKDGSGKRRQLWQAVPGTKKDAERRLTELKHQLDSGTFIRPGKVTVSEYLKQWLRDCCQGLSPKTNELYGYLSEKHIVPAIGNITLVELKPQHLQRLYSDKLSSGLSNETVQIIHRVIHKALKNAVRTNFLVRNVSEYVDKPKVNRRQVKFMSESDIHLLLEFARDTEYYPLFYMALFTGMRRGELLAFRWSDVDLELCQLSISRSLQYLNTGTSKDRIRFGECKTSKSNRLIALSLSTVGMLREYKAKQAELRQLLGLPPMADNDLVFSHYDGSPLLPNSVTHAWIKLTRKCGLNGVRLHDCRHSHASLMLKQGIHPKIVQERLGHSSIRLTLDLYSHVVPGLQQAAANRFDDIVIQGSKQKEKSVERS